MYRSIRWRIAVSYAILMAVVTLGVVLYLSGLVRSSYLADLRLRLANEATLVGEAVQAGLADASSVDLDVLARHYAELTQARVTTIGIDGVVLGDSHEDRTQMDNHLYRVEVQQALSTGEGSAVRFSRTLGYSMLYVAVPVRTNLRLLGVVRLAVPLTDVEASITRLRLAVFGAGIVAIVLAAVVAVFVAERTASPVRLLTGVVERMAEGDLDARLLPRTRDEVGTLTRAFNRMADRLRETVTLLRNQSGRLEGVLEQMTDGVLITDGVGQTTMINPAATRILGTRADQVLMRPFAQSARHHRLIEMWQVCRAGRERQSDSLELERGGPFVQATVTPLEEAEAGSCLVLLQDLTERRRLERVRQGFVANISHELRTPLASLKAVVDTLRDGALDDPAAARHFLDRMDTEVGDLVQMVEELLELSRIESGRVPFRMQPIHAERVIRSAVERLLEQAERSGVQVNVDVPKELPLVLADGERLQQVMTNLVHNAIKFTPAGGRVTVSAKADEADLSVSVADTGIGISPLDLPRIFERFFKADPARASGGTGLGLSIAKHIIQAHKGRIWAESTEGQGSVFHFTLPLAPGNGSLEQNSAQA